MSDNWSLKGKEITVDYKELDGFDLPVYVTETIEILRQKILEDVNKWIGEHENCCVKYTSNAHYELKNIINKKFGLEDIN